MNDHKQMPIEIAELHGALWQELVWLHAKRHTFCQLYASQEAVDLLNRSAPSLFAIYQEVLISDVLMAISRLSDPASTGSGKRAKENLTLARLVNAVDGATCPEVRADLDHALTVMRDDCEFARENRNRRIAHSDLETALRGPSNPLPAVTRNRIENTLRAICDIMNKVEGYFHDSDTHFESPPMDGDGSALLIALKHAEAYREQRRRERRG
jgi:AbiU2